MLTRTSANPVHALTRLLLPGFICSLLVPAPGYAEEIRLLNLSFRGRVAGETVLGKDQPEEFEAYDLSASFTLPWARYSDSDWGLSTRLMTSAGLISGGGEQGVIVSAIPGIAWGRKDGRFSVDAGVGAALMSRYAFGTQDFGGPFQFALTAGAGFPVFKRLGLGYRFMHYSDAGVNGADTIGADFHMIELNYRF
jgi:Lipid A 3-O-deacylase (PagL)